MRKALLLGVVVGIALALVVGSRCQRWWAIDRCVDRGGRWDHAADRCDLGDAR